MSKTILRKCLALVDEDSALTPLLNHSNSNDKQKQKTKQKKKQETKRNYIAERKLQIASTSQLDSFLKQNKSKSKPKFTVKQAKEKMKRVADKTEENVRRLLALDNQLKLNGETKDMILKRAHAGHYVVPQKEEKVEEDVFTEEDFAKFEREYFCK